MGNCIPLFHYFNEGGLKKYLFGENKPKPSKRVFQCNLLWF